MNQEIIVERLEYDEKNGKTSYKPVISSLGLEYDDKGNITGYYQLGAQRPHISIQMNTIEGQPAQCNLIITNPDREFTKGLYLNQFKIKAGYSWFEAGRTIAQIQTIFVGKVYLPTSTSQSGVDTALIIPLNFVPFVGLGETKIYYVKDGHTIKGILDEIIDKDALEIDTTDLDVDWEQEKCRVDFQWLDDDENPRSFNELKEMLAGNQIDATIYGGTLFLRDLSKKKEEEKKAREEAKKKAQARKTGKKPAPAEPVPIKVNEGNVAVIPNQHINDTRNGIVPTWIATRYASVGINATFGLELAFFVPQLVTYRFCSVQNPDTNINIVASVQHNEKSVSQGVFEIMQQQSSFDTFGASQHSLTLLVRQGIKIVKGNEKK